MFLKPYKLKSNAPLKGSDSKRLRQRVEQTFPNMTEAQMQQLWHSKASTSMLTVITAAGFNTKVFCIDKLPMFFEIEGGTLVPTLYVVWQVPDLLPYFTTVPEVLPKLLNGADLMLPGVTPQGTGVKTWGQLKKDAIVAVNLTSNKSAVGVGYLPRSSEDLYMSGGRGVAVKMLHLFGDKLWSHEPTLVKQVPNNRPADLKDGDFPELGAHKIVTAKEQTTILVKATTTNTPMLLAENAVDSTTINATDLQSIKDLTLAEDANQMQANTNNADNEEISPNLILRNAFLAALKIHGTTLQLPLLTSSFYRLYVVPEAQKQIDLKKTKYKKLSNFLNEMVEEGFLVVREENKGIDKITAINFEHSELINFITDYKKPTNNAGTTDTQEPLFHSELTELYIVTDETAPFFTKLNYKRNEGITCAQVKKIVREYISKNNLAAATDSDGTKAKSFKLDECLATICVCSEAPLNRICSILCSKMNRTYEMCSIKDMPSNRPTIQMSLATRSGNKKVTLVSNIECYGIILSEFIKLCKQGAAASTTTVKLPNQKREQLQIQGNQIRFIYNLLTETYKVPAKCIIGLELAKDGRKQKKKL